MSIPLLSLSKAQRLRTPGEFRHVYQSKQFGGSAFHTFNVLAKETGCPRLGVTVSKKVSKKAVTRNAIKRQIKEFYRAHQADIISADLVITARPKCVAASRQEQHQSLVELWAKVMKWQRWHQAAAKPDFK